MWAAARAVLLAWLLALVATITFASSAFALDVPPLEGRVNDRAGLLEPAQRGALERKLAAYEQQTGHEFALLTIDTLQGDALEPFSIRVVEAWKLGKKGRDDGLLLLVVKNDRKVRIENGYGLEGRITDAVSAKVIREVITPAFREDRYAEGVFRGMDALMRVAADGEIPAGPPPPTQRPRASSWGATLAFIVLGLLAGPLFLFLMIVGGLSRLARPLRHRHHRGPFSGGPPMIFPGGGGWFGGGGGHGGGGSGGFSGGGGEFGGGGASGSW